MDFSTDIAGTDEDTQVEITFEQLMEFGSHSDIDGTVEAFKVLSVAGGNLSMGISANTATTFMVGSNDTISNATNAYWTPDANANTAVDGDQFAFTVVAVDNDGDYSSTPITTTIDVNDINDKPVLTTFDNFVATTDEDTEITLSFNQLLATSDATDRDGNIKALIVDAVLHGSMRIGVSAELATPYSTSNNTIDATHNAYWTPDPNFNTGTRGPLASFNLLAKDDDGDVSESSIAAVVYVADINDNPILTGLSDSVETTDEDTEVEITFTELLSQAEYTEIDGTIESILIQELKSGHLRIGQTALSATDYSTTENYTLTSDLNAYWTPDANVNSPSNGNQEAFSIIISDDDGGYSDTSATATVYVNEVNDLPTLSGIEIHSTIEDQKHQISFSDLQNLIPQTTSTEQ